MRTVCRLLWSLVLVLTACRASGPPRPTPPVNAVFGTEVQLCDYRQPAAAQPAAELAATGDARVRARCRTHAEFGRRPRGRNWVEHWSVVMYDVVHVERGTWPDRALSFVVMDLRPTPESGILLKAVWHYRPGAELLFELDTRCQPAEILGRALLPTTAETDPRGRTIARSP